MKPLKILFLAALLTTLSACSTVVPVHEAEPPEVLTGGQFRLTSFAANSPMIATENGDPSNSAILLPSEGYRLSAGLRDQLQLNFEVLAAGLSGGGSFSLKYQWTGDPYFKAKKGNRTQSTIVRSFSTAGVDLDVDDNGNLYPYADLSASGLDLTHVWGYRTANWFGVYGGPKLITGDVTAEYKNVEDGPVVEKEERSFSGYGVVAGLFFAFTGKHIGFDITLEYDGFELPASYGKEKVWYNGYAVAFALPFGF